MFFYEKNIIKSITVFVLFTVFCSFGSSLTYANSTKNNLQELFAKEIDTIHNNDLMSDEQKISEILEIYFYSIRDYLTCNNQCNDSIYSITDQESHSIKAFINKIKTKKELFNYKNFKILWDTLIVEFEHISVDGNQANVELTETYKYILNNYENGISSCNTKYEIKLNKIGERWIIANIKSDDENDLIYLTEGFDLEKHINELKNEKPIIDQENERKYTAVKNIEQKIKYGESDIGIKSMYLYPYDRVDALMYIITYDGSARNPRFYDYSAIGGDCQNFGSQCIWYGLGGVNDASMIDGKYFPMVDNGKTDPRSWYSTSIKYDTPNTYVWTGVDHFDDYIDDSGYNIQGPYGTIYSGIAYAERGDLIQIRANSTSDYHHTYVVYGVQGTAGSRTKDDIWVSSHTADRSNEKLSDCCSYSLSNMRTIHIIGTYSY